VRVLTHEEVMKAANKLATIYRLTDTNPRSIDPMEKERLYVLANQYREIHYLALKICNEEDRL
jgi:hypothetical protein